MKTKQLKKTSKRKIIDEELSNDDFYDAIQYINYISTIKTFDAIDVLPVEKKTFKKNTVRKKVKFEDKIDFNSSNFECENLDKENEKPPLVRRVSGRKAAAAALAAIKETTLNIINQEQETEQIPAAKQNKLESIKFDHCKPISNYSISAELKKINATSNYVTIAMEICRVLFTYNELKTGYFYDESDGPILPNKLNLDTGITNLLKNTIKIKLGLTEMAMNETWKTLRKELNSILIKNQDDLF